MYKDQLLEIYQEVNSRFDESHFPTTIDYVDAILKKTDESFLTKTKAEVHSARESIRRSVSNALGKLNKRGILKKVGNKYVTPEKKLAYISRQTLIESKCLDKAKIVKVSKRVFLLVLNTNTAFENYKNSNTLEEHYSTPESAIISSNNIDEPSCTTNVMLTTVDNGQELVQLEALQSEIALLQKQIEVLLKEHNFKKVFVAITETIQNYLGYLPYVNVLPFEKNIVIVADTDVKEDIDFVIQKLEEVIPKKKKKEKKPIKINMIEQQ